MIMVYICYVGMEKGLVSLSAFILTLRSHLFKNNFVILCVWKYNMRLLHRSSFSSHIT